MKILAVDDDGFALDIIQAALTSAGYEDLTSAQSAAAALALIRAAEAPYDCILLDIVMPDIDGIELCSRIRALPGYGDVPIIMITSVEAPHMLERAIAAGATDYVGKPLNGIELGARLRAASLLSAALKTGKPMQMTVPVGTAPVRDADAFRPDDAFSIDGHDGLVALTRLSAELAGADPARGETTLMLAQVIETFDLLGHAGNADLRALIGGIGKEIATLFAPWGGRVAYAGSGVFCIALRSSAALKRETLRALPRLGLRSVTVDAPSIRLREVHLAFQYLGMAHVQSGSEMVTVMHTAVENLRSESSLRERQQSLAELRRVLGPKGADVAQHTWDVCLGITQGAAAGRVMPRRVKPKV